MAESRAVSKLINELHAHVSESVRAANAGDARAKRWLLAVFPGNRAHLKELWREQHRTGRSVVGNGQK